MASPAPASPAAPTRRDLTRQFKETRRPMGVYAIRNLADERVFVGGSMDLPAAMNRHRFELERRGHRHRALQQDWLRLGAQSFQFEVLATVKERDDPAYDHRAELEALLQAWREELGAFGDRGYNTPGDAVKGARP